MKNRMQPIAVALTALGLVAVAPFAEARQLDPDKPEDALQLARKMACSLEDGVPVIYWWYGTALSRVPGERDRELFKVQGMNIRQCGSYTDPARGPGFRSVSREVLLYLDPETGEVLRTWKNPWTGKEVDVIHVQNDPVNARAPTYAYAADGTPYRFRGEFHGDKVIQSGEAPLWYPNPLGGDYQEYVGGTYHAMEMLNSYADAEELLDADDPLVENVTISWARVSQWLPWMEMGDRTGLMFFTTVGKRVASIDDLSEPLRTEIRTRYPKYQTPPPLDDARPNETTWTFVKKTLDAERPDQQKEGAR